MSDHVLLAAAGDISFHGDTGDAVLRQGPDYAFAEIKPVIADADLRFANMESTLIPPDFPPGELSPKALASVDTVAPALKASGIDVLTMASNHVLDCGTIGMEHTRKTLTALGIKTFGAGLDVKEAHKPLVIEKNGLKIGFLGYQEDCNYSYGHVGAGPAYLEEKATLRDMKKLRPRVDVLILSLHADLEFMETPSVWRRDLSRRLAGAGADLILEHHPHVPQGVERAGKCLIAYSMGNFVFDAHIDGYMKDNGPHTGHSFVLKVQLSKDGAGDFDRIPFDISQPPGQRPVPMTGTALDEGRRYLEYLDKQLADDKVVLENWRKRCVSMVEIYLRRFEKMPAEKFMERWAWVLFGGVHENLSWTSEIFRMARERFEQEAHSDKPYLKYHRPSYRYE
jgi:poly-gamma-glutamate synthesis protein (capsule biosynthesis protein)